MIIVEEVPKKIKRLELCKTCRKSPLGCILESLIIKDNWCSGYVRKGE